MSRRFIGRWRHGLLALSLCVAGASIAQDRPAEPRVVTPGTFERLELHGAAHVRVVQGPRDQVTVSGDPQLQRDLEIELLDDKLIISPNGNWKFWNPDRLQIEVMMRQIKQLVLAGSGELQAPQPLNLQRLVVHISASGRLQLQDVHAEVLSLQISGMGQAQLRGRVQESAVRIEGRGQVQAEQLRADRCRIRVVGIGQVRPWCTEQLWVGVTGMAAVDYYGTPEVQREGLFAYAQLKALGPKPASP